MGDETLWQEDALKKQYFKHIRSIQKDAPTTRAFIKNLMLLRPKWPKGTARAKDAAADAAPKRPRPAVNISAASSSVVVVSESGVTGSGFGVAPQSSEMENYALRGAISSIEELKREKSTLRRDLAALVERVQRLEAANEEGSADESTFES